MNRKLWFVILSAILLAVVVNVPSYAAQTNIEREIKTGQKVSEKLEKELKIVHDEALQKRLDSIGQKLAAVARSTRVPAKYGSDELADFNYTFKIVDDKTVNAFSLPGGIIYVHKGLLDKVESDDELAGVLAHEITHAAHHHVAALAKKESKYTTRMLIATVIGLVLTSGAGTDMSSLLMGAPLISVARLNAYGREAEKDSDVTAVSYMVDAGYNPVGLLTFMEKLSKEYIFSNDRLGIYATHPAYRDRAEYIINELKTRNISINRRDVCKILEVTVQDGLINGQVVSQVCLEGKPVFAAAEAGGHSSRERADVMAKKLDAALDAQPTTRDVKVSPDGKSLLVGDRVVIEFSPEDARIAEKSLQELVSNTRKCINRPIYDNWLEMECMKQQ